MSIAASRVRPSSAAPTMTLARLFGSGVAYLPRRSPNLHGWSPRAPGFVDFQTGHQLAVAGPIHYVACAGVATPEILACLAEVGLPIEADLQLYRGADDYLTLIGRLGARGLRLAAQRVHPSAEIPDSMAYVPLALQQDLNDKGRMADIVPAEWLPVRRLVDVSALPASAVVVRDGRPVVLKAATRLPNGGGHAVWICRTPADVDRARAALATERQVVVEDFLEIERTVCVHAVVGRDGAAGIVGVAEEVCEGERYLGNWLDAAADEVPAEVFSAVTRIVERAAASGYRGIVGVDVAFVAGGAPRVLDLNFRVNGSTASTWLRARLGADLRSACMRLRGWTADDTANMLRIARAAVRRGVLIPLGAYDPAACDMGGVPRLHGLVVGPSREAVGEEERRLAAEGLR
jgi:hypothetical protein